MLSPEDINAEIDILAKRAGLTVFPERREKIAANYIEIRKMVDLLHGWELQPSDEGSNVFDLTRFLQEGDA